MDIGGPDILSVSVVVKGHTIMNRVVLLRENGASLSHVITTVTYPTTATFNPFSQDYHNRLPKDLDEGTCSPSKNRDRAQNLSFFGLFGESKPTHIGQCISDLTDPHNLGWLRGLQRCYLINDNSDSLNQYGIPLCSAEDWATISGSTGRQVLGTVVNSNASGGNIKDILANSDVPKIVNEAKENGEFYNLLIEEVQQTALMRWNAVNKKPTDESRATCAKKVGLKPNWTTGHLNAPLITRIVCRPLVKENEKCNDIKNGFCSPPTQNLVQESA